MDILIYDDNENDINHLKICINNFFQETKQEYNITICKSKDELLKNIDNYDLLFLDIEINNENGIDIGFELQKIRHDCRIIITTNYSKYAIDGYKIQADRYFIKPIVQKEFNLEMNTIINKYIKKSVGFFDKKICNHKIYTKDILYIEYLDRKSLIYKTNGKIIKTNYNLKYWYNKLCNHGFAYSYKAFLINLEYISAFKKNEIVMINNEKIPLSRHFKKEFEITYHNFLHDSL